MLQFFDRLTTVPEQVIEVPKIFIEDVLKRAVLRATQLVEQLVEVPTIVSYASLAFLQVMQRIAEQNVDIPAVGGSGAGGGLSGFLSGQHYSMTAEHIVDNPVLRPVGAGGLQGLPRGQSSTTFSEQIAEFPDPGGGRQDFQPVRVFFGFSWTSWRRVFSHFSQPEKKCEDPAHPGGVGLMDPVSLAGVSSVAQHGVRLLLLVAERRGWCFLVCSSGLRLEQLLVQTVLGRLSVMEAFGSISSSTCLFVALVALGNLDFAFVRCLVPQWINVLREALDEFHIFSTCGELRPEAFSLLSYRMEKCAQLMLRVAVCLSAVRTLKLNIISTSSTWWRCGVFSTHFASFYALLRLSRS